METFLTDFIGYVLTKVLWDWDDNCCLWLESVTLVLETFFSWVCATSYMKSNKWKHIFFPKKGKKFSSYWAHDKFWASVALVTQSLMLGRDLGTV